MEKKRILTKIIHHSSEGRLTAGKKKVQRGE